MADYTPDRGKLAAQAAFQIIHALMHVVHAQRRLDLAVEVHDLALVGLTDANIVDRAKESGAGRNCFKGSLDFHYPLRRSVPPRHVMRLQRLDMRFDFDIRPELVV